jgi:hypothetical protein
MDSPLKSSDLISNILFLMRSDCQRGASCASPNRIGRNLDFHGWHPGVTVTSAGQHATYKCAETGITGSYAHDFMKSK